MADRTITPTKPSRSDDVLDQAQQIAITEQVKAQFDSLVPKRPLKPSRSDPDPHPQPFLGLGDHYSIPELDKLRSLRSQQSPGLFKEADDPVREDFTETQYYDQMQSIDKQHHTTGNGFIKVAMDGGEENAGDYYPNIKLKGGEAVAVRSNPATNDWVPASPDYDEVYVSSKPKRSESD
ncbi:hypothetical protein MLD38_007322 [Melastoma candidum]|uniref:Uncharacterized protein n=1 Tax=Melastoma candidum TaxID=119954 RepID=A0ACB9RRZ8_9MYRT|nr:hypothetical protein MLD38_007322 [Melastoma candidum]